MQQPAQSPTVHTQGVLPVCGMPLNQPTASRTCHIQIREGERSCILEEGGETGPISCCRCSGAFGYCLNGQPWQLWRHVLNPSTIMCSNCVPTTGWIITFPLTPGPCLRGTWNIQPGMSWTPVTRNIEGQMWDFIRRKAVKLVYLEPLNKHTKTILLSKQQQYPLEVNIILRLYKYNPNC